jgi:D-aminoacyl-tRNA deacylase
MRALIRRVQSASVLVSEKKVGSIQDGLLIYLGVHTDDQNEDLSWIIKKILGLRIFEDEEGRMNRSINPQQGILLISQFTLFGNLRKGYRPSLNQAANPITGKMLYEQGLAQIKEHFDGDVQAGVFGANMQINAVDDGPVTIWVDSKNRSY